jgi:phenylacetate-CoA ligase
MSKRASLLDFMQGNTQGIVWPPIVREPVAGLAAMLAVLDRTQWMKRRDLVVQQYRQLVVLAEHLARHSKQFAARMEAAKLVPSDLGSEEGLRRLPVLRRRDLQIPEAELHCASIPQGHGPLGESRTSGSTGEPVSIRRTSINLLVWRASNIRSQIWQGTDFAKRTTTIRPQFQKYSLAPDRGAPLNQLFKTGPVQGIPIVTDIKEQAALLREFKPDNLIIYPTNLDHLCRHIKAHGGAPEGLSFVYTIGETLSDRVRQQTNEVLGARVLDKYSSQEMGLIAAECPDSGLYHIMAENLLVEVVKDDGSPCRIGDGGRVLVTDLHNFATPLVRYDIRDYAEVGGACPCGRGLPTLKRILGRERNLLVKPDGTRNWPLIGFHQFPAIAPIHRYQFIQHDLKTIEMRLVCDSALSKAQENKLASVIKAALAYDFDLKFSYFEGDLPRSAGGKFEEFVSMVNPSQP